MKLVNISRWNLLYDIKSDSNLIFDLASALS